MREEIIDFLHEQRSQNDIYLRFGFGNDAVRKMIRILLHEDLIAFNDINYHYAIKR
jgi:hypothetical protein